MLYSRYKQKSTFLEAVLLNDPFPALCPDSVDFAKNLRCIEFS